MKDNISMYSREIVWRLLTILKTRGDIYHVLGYDLSEDDFMRLLKLLIENRYVELIKEPDVCYHLTNRGDLYLHQLNTQLHRRGLYKYMISLSNGRMFLPYDVNEIYVPSKNTIKRMQKDV